MLLKAIGPFVLSQVFAKLVLGDKIAADEEFQGIVYCGTADSVVLVFHMYIQGFGIKVIIASVNLLENGISFGGFA